MTDEELIEGFEDQTLAPERFRHREHVRLTWLLLARYGREETGRRMLDGLRAFAVRAGKPEKFDAPLTRAWVAAIADAAAETEASTFESLVALRPELLTRDGVRSRV